MIDMDLIVVAGAICGQIVHVIKKRTEDGKEDGASEWSVFRRWVLARPVNTIAAALVGCGASLGLATTTDPLLAFLQALVTGIAANSVVNRPGE
ncbi:MAG: hypothetical protein A2Z99_08170 [Treponema sp. GWB1_62_6]|nr:MAG: hypothetical protein A2Z99_08170 [Treponema sp. GWB1_62_6]